jgi:DNA excision repair protein ERCC-4
VYTGKATGNTSEGAADAFPDTLRPVLEEQPKWAHLAEVLDEIERDTYLNPVIRDDSNGTILIMCSDQATCRQLKEYLRTMHMKPERVDQTDEPPDGVDDNSPSAEFMMRRKLRDYLAWKGDFAKVRTSLFAQNQRALDGAVDARHGSHSYRGKAPPNKRRRVRGGAAAAVASGPSRAANGAVAAPAEPGAHVAELLGAVQLTELEAQHAPECVNDPLQDMEDYFELFDMDDLLVIHPYDGDLDEHLLEEVKPRYIIMYEPDAAFIRRVEVYRSSHSDRNVRVYFIYYGGSVEEQRYLSAVRREKDAFSKLIRERAVCRYSIVTSCQL